MSAREPEGACSLLANGGFVFIAKIRAISSVGDNRALCGLPTINVAWPNDIGMRQRCGMNNAGHGVGMGYQINRIGRKTG